MEPNETLKEMRRLVKKILVDETYLVDLPGVGIVQFDDGQRLAELAEALDEWIGKGGFLPDAWKPEKNWVVYTETDPEACDWGRVVERDNEGDMIRIWWEVANTTYTDEVTSAYSFYTSRDEAEAAFRKTQRK
jgi:hypothetical protein